MALDLKSIRFQELDRLVSKQIDAFDHFDNISWYVCPVTKAKEVQKLRTGLCRRFKPKTSSQKSIKSKFKYDASSDLPDSMREYLAGKAIFTRSYQADKSIASRASITIDEKTCSFTVLPSMLSWVYPDSQLEEFRNLRCFDLLRIFVLKINTEYYALLTDAVMKNCAFSKLVMSSFPAIGIDTSVVVQGDLDYMERHMHRVLSGSL